MLISNSIRDGIITHDEFLEILKEKLIALYVKKTQKIKIQKFLKRKLGQSVMIKSVCSVCNKTKSRFVSKNEGSGLLSSLGIRTPLSKILGLNILF